MLCQKKPKYVFGATKISHFLSFMEARDIVRSVCVNIKESGVKRIQEKLKRGVEGTPKKPRPPLGDTRKLIEKQ